MALKKASGGKYDVVFTTENQDTVGWEIVSHLETKGFCVCDPGLEDEIFAKARTDIEDFEALGKLERPPEQIVDGLLGNEGSSRILGLTQRDKETTSENLAQLDDLMTTTASIMNDVLWTLGFQCPTRTTGLIHETGTSDDAPEELTEGDASDWLITFMRHKIMILLVLGPIKGTLELSPFEEEAETLEIATQPGSMILLRADTMLHKHFAHSKVHLLSCFLLESKPSGKSSIAGQKLVQTPCAIEIEKWAVERMRQLKEDEAEKGHILSNLPDSWTAAMNRMFHTVQRVAIRGLAGRYATTWTVDTWNKVQASGVDNVVEVPLQRWQADLYYDRDPEGWRMGKTFLRHGSFMDGAELFDCRFFGLSPAEAGGMDPHQREVLEVGYDALHLAGYKKGKLMNTLGGVYLGSTGTIFGMVSQVSGATGGAASINSNRFSFCLGLKGPSLTCDTEGSSSLSAVYIGAEAVLEKGRGQINELSLSGGVSIQLGTVFWPQLQVAGLLCPAGRCLTWDQSADGYCMGDGCGFVVLKRLTEMIDNEMVYIEGEPLYGVVAGSTMNSNGINSTMNAPSGPSEQELVANALHQAAIKPLNIDCVECNGQGAFMADAIEVDALMRILRPEYVVEPLSLTNVKSRTGHLIEAAGVASIHRAILANNIGMMTPNNHLVQINPHIDHDNNANYLTESLEYPQTSSYTGVTSRGFGGTNVHVIVFGQVDAAKYPIQEDVKPASFIYWPGGGGELEESQVPNRGYYITGTFNRWDSVPMQDEGNGSYGYTITMGENRWEEFQILLDGDVKKRLHPAQPFASKGGKVDGPDVSTKGINWRINGQTQLDAGGNEITFPDHSKPGDKFRVHLQVAGKFQTVMWEKLEESDSAVPSGDYYVVSDWNGWVPEKMTKGADSWTLECSLMRTGGEFQILRDADWCQVICPNKPRSEGSTDGFGPDHCIEARGFNWYLGGKPGQFYKIEMKDGVTSEFGIPDFPVKKVSWTKERDDTITDEQKLVAKRAKFGVVGTWSGYLSPMSEVAFERQEAGGYHHYSFLVQIGPEGEESFQLLQDLSWERIIHPSHYTDRSGAAVQVVTSMNDGSALNLVWTIGKESSASPGKTFKVKVVAIGDRVVNVTWNQATGPDMSGAVVLQHE